MKRAKVRALYVDSTGMMRRGPGGALKRAGLKVSPKTAPKRLGRLTVEGARRGKTARTPSGAVRMTLRALRDSVGKTQGDVAREVSMTQPQLSRVESRRDHLVSTLRKYVGALGGQIEVIAVIDGVRISLQNV
jgi:hypothetical protein